MAEQTTEQTSGRLDTLKGFFKDSMQGAQKGARQSQFARGIGGLRKMLRYAVIVILVALVYLFIGGGPTGLVLLAAAGLIAAQHPFWGLSLWVAGFTLGVLGLLWVLGPGDDPTIQLMPLVAAAVLAAYRYVHPAALVSGVALAVLVWATVHLTGNPAFLAAGDLFVDLVGGSGIVTVLAALVIAILALGLVGLLVSFWTQWDWPGRLMVISLAALPVWEFLVRWLAYGDDGDSKRYSCGDDVPFDECGAVTAGIPAFPIQFGRVGFILVVGLLVLWQVYQGRERKAVENDSEEPKGYQPASKREGEFLEHLRDDEEFMEAWQGLTASGRELVVEEFWPWVQQDRLLQLNQDRFLKKSLDQMQVSKEEIADAELKVGEVRWILRRKFIAFAVSKGIARKTGRIPSSKLKGIASNPKIMDELLVTPDLVKEEIARQEALKQQQDDADNGS
ncbi:MAG: hypothetical protein M3N59_00875 [bacterium]|nr:hypothetical protein [bacterium]